MITIVRQRQWYNHKKKTATSNDRHGVSNYLSIECLFNNLLRPTTTKNHRSVLLTFCAGNPPVTVEFPAEMDSYKEYFPFDDVIIHTVRIFVEAYCIQTCCNIHAYVYDIPPQLRLRSCEISFDHNIFHMCSFVWKLCSDDGSDIFVL